MLLVVGFLEGNHSLSQGALAGPTTCMIASERGQENGISEFQPNLGLWEASKCLLEENSSSFVCLPGVSTYKQLRGLSAGLRGLVWSLDLSPGFGFLPWSLVVGILLPEAGL